MNNYTDRDIREVIKKRDPNYNSFMIATSELQMVNGDVILHFNLFR